MQKESTLFVSTRWAGGTHDSTAFGVTNLSSRLEEDVLFVRYWIAGDEAYACPDRLLTPWSGRGLTPEKVSFNYIQSKLRTIIECALV